MTNAIRSGLGKDDMVFNVYWFHGMAMDPAHLTIILAGVTDFFRKAGSPIQFKLAANQLIEETDLSPKVIVGLQEKHCVLEQGAMNIFSAHGYGGGFSGAPDPKAAIHIGSVVAWIGDASLKVAQETMAHEVGHWLGLAHTHKGGCFPGDNVSDTKPIEYNEDGSIAPNSCGFDGNTRDNFMDYGYTAEYPTFTPGQAYRMMVFAYFRLFGELPGGLSLTRKSIQSVSISIPKTSL